MSFRRLAVSWMGAGMAAIAMMGVVACAGGGGGGDSDPVSAGLSSNFIADTSPSCPGSPDSLGLRKFSALGQTLTLGLEVTDCDASLGVYGTTFEIAFDPVIVQCTMSNPCQAGTVLSPPLATTTPQCECDNGAGRILGVFSKKSPGGNESVSAAGMEDLVQIILKVRREGLGRVELLNTGTVNGSSLVTLSGTTPTAIPGLTYISGTVVGQ